MDVVFAVLPFADVERPAIGVSLLKAEVERVGFSSKVLYLNFDLAEMIGIELCGFISESLPADTLVGEWFFADLLFGDRIPDPLDYVAKILSFHADIEISRRIVDARKHRAQFLERAMSRFMQLKPRVVGFTTTFHQTCACLLLAQRLKRQSNPPFIVFGGANCEGEMGLELLRRFDFIDYVCTREGDVAFPLLLENLLHQQKFVAIPGMVRQGESTVLTTPDLVRDLNSLPIPDYADYFERVAESPLAGTFKSDLLIETSRGCWWGAKHHCTFCGLNGDTMEFRRKSPQRAYEEMKFLSAKYGVKRISCVDNILDTRLIPTLFPMLIEGGLDLELFYEVKANLRYDQLELMRAGGVTSVQPGIESFSDRILSLMEKGCTGLMNIQLLRWCEEFGILPAWNILSGFPGEAPADYEWTAQLLPRLTHLQPPSACSPIRLDRFSPFFTRAQRFGFEGIRPSPAYYYVYPFGRREMARLAYFFDFDYADGRNPRTNLVNVRREVDNWYMLRNPSTKPEDYPRLDAKCVDDGALLITDTRPCAPASSHVLTGSEAQVLLACDHYQSFTVLARQFRPALDEIKLRDLLASLESQALLVSQNNNYVALPIFRERQEASGKKCHVDAEI